MRFNVDKTEYLTVGNDRNVDLITGFGAIPRSNVVKYSTIDSSGACEVEIETQMHRERGVARALQRNSLE